MEEKVFFESGGVRLAGVVHSPGPGKWPAVVLCHGFKSSKASCQRLGEALETLGFVALRFDFFGHGESAGSFPDVTISEEVRDLKAALGFLEAREDVDADRVGVFGSSLGGMVSILTAAADRRVQALALRAPACDMREIIKKSEGKAKIDTWELNGVTVTVSQKTGEKFKIKYGFYLDAVRHDVYQAAAKIQVPVIIFHGDQDDVVPFSQAEKLAGKLKRAELVVGKGDKHILGAEEKAAVVRQAADWFAQKLEPSACSF